jgi:hypothetical protein
VRQRACHAPQCRWHRRRSAHGYSQRRLHARWSKRICLTGPSPGCGMHWGAPTQVAHRRGSERDSFAMEVHMCIRSSGTAGDCRCRTSSTESAAYPAGQGLMSTRLRTLPPPWLTIWRDQDYSSRISVEVMLYPEGPTQYCLLSGVLALCNIDQAAENRMSQSDPGARCTLVGS